MFSGYKTYLIALLTIVAAVLGCMTDQLTFELAVEMIIPAVLAATLRHGIARGKPVRHAAVFVAAMCLLAPGCAANEQRQVGQDSWQHVAVIVGPTDPTALYLTTVESDKDLSDADPNTTSTDGDSLAASDAPPTSHGSPASQWGYYGNITINVSGKGEGSTSNGDVSQTPRGDLQAEVSGNSAELGLPLVKD